MLPQRIKGQQTTSYLDEEFLLEDRIRKIMDKSRRRHAQLERLLMVCEESFVADVKDKDLLKMIWKLKLDRPIKDQVKPRRQRDSKAIRHASKFPHDDDVCKKRFGISRSNLIEVHDKVEELFDQTSERKHYNSKFQLMVTLEFLKEYPGFAALGAAYCNISSSTAHRIVMNGVAILREKLDYIKWPSVLIPKPYLGGVYHGAIDCSTHERRRVHPGQGDYYRFDKGHGLTVQVIVGPDKMIMDLQVFLGHNNDQGCVLESIYEVKSKDGIMQTKNLKEYLMQDLPDVRILGDKGYRYKFTTFPNLVTEYTVKQKLEGDWKTVETDWDPKQREHFEDTMMDVSASRAIVEHIFTAKEVWKILKEPNKESPEFQAMAIIVVYNLFNLRRKNEANQRLIRATL